MPHIQIKLVAGRTVEQKRELAAALTETFTRITGNRPESVWITFDDVPAENWAIAGTLLSER